MDAYITTGNAHVGGHRADVPHRGTGSAVMRFTSNRNYNINALERSSQAPLEARKP